jgi:hypothetical protein
LRAFAEFIFAESARAAERTSCGLYLLREKLREQPRG